MPDYRHTKIVATIGPATDSDERLAEMISAGVDVIRLNMAHGTAEWVGQIASRIRDASSRVGRHVAIMIDVKGPEIRTGPVEKPVDLSVGMTFELRTDITEANVEEPLAIPVNYVDLPKDVDVGSVILIDSGLIRVRVVDRGETFLTCEVITPGKLGSRRHINLPGVEVNLPALTAKDKSDLDAGIDAGIDFVALSFVRKAADVDELRHYLCKSTSHARIISKIEDQAGVRNMHEIVRASDAVMVARGDLGIEIDYHRLPLVQTDLVNACQAEGKPVIIATQLLESMIESPFPTRAEISDVCNAVREEADAVMLSGETTIGKYPLEAIEVLKNILRSVEPSVMEPLNTQIVLREPKAKMLRASAVLAQELGNSGIVVFTRSGFLAFVLGALRPRGVPIFAFTDDANTFHHLLLPWGVEPFLVEFYDDPEVTIQNALSTLKDKQWCSPGTWLAVITNALADDKIIDTMQLRQVQ